MAQYLKMVDMAHELWNFWLQIVFSIAFDLIEVVQVVKFARVDAYASWMRLKGMVFFLWYI